MMVEYVWPQIHYLKSKWVRGMGQVWVLLISSLTVRHGHSVESHLNRKRRGGRIQNLVHEEAQAWYHLHKEIIGGLDQPFQVISADVP